MIHTMTKADYIASQVKLFGKNDPRANTRYCGQIHKNAIAQALGKNESVPTKVLVDYASYDWSTHPLCRNRTDLAKTYITTGRTKGNAINFYALGCYLLSEGMTGIDDK